MIARSLLALALLLTLVPTLPRGAVAADAGGYGGALNLPAMVLTPADLDAAGFPGYGKFGDGAFVPLDVLVAHTAESRGLSENEVRAIYQDAGWRRFYGTHLGLPSVPGNPTSRATQIAFSFVTEYADAAGAAAAFDSLGGHGDDAQARIAAVAGSTVVGDESRIESTAVVDSEAGPDTELAILFRRGTLIGSVGFELCCTVASLLGTAAYALPDAWPIPGSAATVAEVETLATRLLAKMEATLAAADPGLSGAALRLDRATAPIVYASEGYRIRDGETPPFYGGFADDILALPAVFAGVEEVYEVEQLLEVGEEPADYNPYYVLRLMRFADDDAASAFLATYPAALDTGAGSVSGAVPVEGAAQDLGDEALALAFGAVAADSPPAAYEIDVRVGATVAVVFLGSTPRPDLAIVEELARAQVACLRAAVCTPVPMPPALLAAPMERALTG
ncbi:MAG: hypothetical protein M3N33_01185 [Actinomycetota bacterium]|nr:hypothetical protein [Actinomycetota bacterium]